jgi:hypothetical protein
MAQAVGKNLRIRPQSLVRLDEKHASGKSLHGRAGSAHAHLTNALFGNIRWHELPNCIATRARRPIRRLKKGFALLAIRFDLNELSIRL